MNEGAAKQIGEGFLRGFFDTMDALLATGMRAAPGAPGALTAESLTQSLASYPVAMHGMIEDGGRVGILLTVRDALSFQAQVLGEDAPDRNALEGDDIPKLLEVFEPCLGGGVGTLKDLMGREMGMHGVQVESPGAEGAATLLDAFDNNAFAMPFSYEDSEGMRGEGVLIGAQVLFALLPQAAAQSAGSDEPELSPEEMNDILSGFDAGDTPGGGTPAAVAPDDRVVPGNLEMIMDIGLVCTARLGRVEMPIAEVLALGPGSILEVGHLVDEPVELLVNDKLIARGDVVVVDEKFGLRITEIVSQADRIKSML